MIWTNERKELARLACKGWHGTPHRHWMRKPGVGIDCIHFVVDVLEKSGSIPPIEIPRYHDNLGGKGADQKLVAEFASRMPIELVSNPYKFGDILIFDPKLSVNHVGILIDDQIWQSLYGRGVDVYTFQEFKKLIKGAIRLKESNVT